MTPTPQNSLRPVLSRIEGTMLIAAATIALAFQLLVPAQPIYLAPWHMPFGVVIMILLSAVLILWARKEILAPGRQRSRYRNAFWCLFLVLMLCDLPSIAHHIENRDYLIALRWLSQPILLCFVVIIFFYRAVERIRKYEINNSESTQSSGSNA